MVAQPIFTVPKKGSTKLCLVNDHSAGMTLLNSLILAEGGFMKLDNLSELTTNICTTMGRNGGHRPMLLWKSDASQAYHHLPMHPQWKVHQASLIDCQSRFPPAPDRGQTLAQPERLRPSVTGSNL